MTNQLNQFFSSASTTIQIPRLAIAADGLDKRGKSHWAIMTAPDPICVISFDTGTDLIVKKARDKKRRVQVMHVEFEIPDPSIKAKADIDKAQQVIWRDTWEQIRSAGAALVTEPIGKDRTRTLLVDTGTDLNNLLELAYFGKSKGNIQQDIRTEMNSAFHKFFYDLYKKRPDLNIVFTHKKRKQYIGKEWTGKYERQGHTNIGYFMDLTLNFDWDPISKDLYTEIAVDQPFRYMDLTTEESMLVGKRWYATIDPNNPSAFWNLGMSVFPDTEVTPEVWI